MGDGRECALGAPGSERGPGCQWGGGVLLLGAPRDGGAGLLKERLKAEAAL